MWRLLLWAYAVSNTLGMLCDELLNKLLKGVPLVKGRNRMAISKTLVSHLEYRQGASWNMNQPVAEVWEAQKGVLVSEMGRELDHTFVFILTIVLFVWFVQQLISSSVWWAHVWEAFQWCCEGPQLEIPALKPWGPVCGSRQNSTLAASLIWLCQPSWSSRSSAALQLWLWMSQAFFTA